MNLQYHVNYNLNDAVRWIARYFNLSGKIEQNNINDFGLKDWEILDNYDRIKDIQTGIVHVTLEEYDKTILSRFNYNLRIMPWLKEGINQESISKAQIGFYPGADQITIPHFDKDGRFVGLRGRFVCSEDADIFGKYRPIKVNGILYTHPLGLNLYNLNHSRYIIPKFRKAIIFEGEKSCLKYQSYFGYENDISVACCGSNISSYQIQLLINAGAQEIIVAFDRQFQKIGDDEYFHLRNNLMRIKQKYKNYVQISFILDNHKITGYKDSPIDCGRDTFLTLYKNRIN